MQVYFLQADRPLTKTFKLNAENEITKSSYPFVTNFTSFNKDIPDLKTLTDYLIEYGKNGLCMLKGQLTKALVNESRAGSTNPTTKTELLVLDLDDLAGYETIEDFIKEVLPAPFHTAPYILQHSASSGFSDDGFRAHLYFHLTEPVTPLLLKNWLTHINLTKLGNQMGLSANAMALKFPLDRTICQNDKLIYIAPPVCQDVTDPLAGERIVFVDKKNPKKRIDFMALDIPIPAVLDQGVADKVTELRRNLGLRAKRARYKFFDDVRILLNPDHAQVSSEKPSGDFIRLNVNDGDSWGYYFNPKNPRFLYNFKDEPIVILRDFLPDYWLELNERRVNDENAIQHHVFRDFESDTYYNGEYDPVNDRHKFRVCASKGRFGDFFAQYNEDPPAIVEDWRYEFRPDLQIVFDADHKFINQWQPTEMMRLATPVKKIPPGIDRVLHSVVADDPEAYNHFVNWLACIYQYRQKLMTAWVLHGTQGTGKGILFNEVLVPIFGAEHCVTKQLSELNDKFNAQLETCLIYNVDEVRLHISGSDRKLVNQVKAMITEPFASIRAMNRNARQVPSYTNFIFTSNEYDAIHIDKNDRRFNVAPRQETPLVVTEKDIDQIRSEVGEFAGFLLQYEANIEQARKPLSNIAKADMRDASMDSAEQMFEAVIQGNLEYFIAFIEDHTGNQTNLMSYSAYLEVVKKWFSTANQRYVVRTQELLDVYLFLQDPHWNKGVNIFKRMCAHKNIQLAKPSRCNVRDKVVRGHQTIFSATEQQLEEWAVLLEGKKPKTKKVTPIK